MPADFSMQATHAIHRPAPAYGEIRHVETLRGVVRVLATQGQQVAEFYAELLLGIITKILLNERRSETVKAGSHCRVSGEEIADPSRGQCHFERLPGFFHEASGTLQHREGRMTFIQVTDFRFMSERSEQPPAADPEKQFLLETQLRPAPVELARDPAMSGKVRRVITVEQIQLYSTDLDLPGTQPDRVTRQRDLQPQPLPIWLTQRSDRQLSGIVVGIKSLLRSLLIDHLAKITLLVQQPNSNHRHAQIAGCFELIAGHIAKSSRIDGERFTQHEFHAEIRDAGQGGLWILLLKPCRSLRRLMLGP